MMSHRVRKNRFRVKLGRGGVKWLFERARSVMWTVRVDRHAWCDDLGRRRDTLRGTAWKHVSGDIRCRGAHSISWKSGVPCKRHGGFFFVVSARKLSKNSDQRLLLVKIRFYLLRRCVHEKTITLDRKKITTSSFHRVFQWRHSLCA